MKQPKKVHWIADENGCDLSHRISDAILRTEVREKVTCKICNALLNKEAWAEKYRFSAQTYVKSFEYENKMDGQLRCYKTTDWQKKPYLHVSIYDAYAGFSRGKWITYYDIKDEEYELMKDKSDEEIIEYAKQIKENSPQHTS